MTEQTPETTPQPPAEPTVDPASQPAPAPVDPASTTSTQTAPTEAPAPADTTTTAPAPAPTTTTAPAPPKVGDLCTFVSEDGAGFETLTTCVVFEVFSEPDEDGNDVDLARVGVLPDERIVKAARLETRS